MVIGLSVQLMEGVPSLALHFPQPTWVVYQPRSCRIIEQAGYRELLAPWVRPMLVVGIGLAIFQQFVGINTVIYNAPTIIKSTGLADVASVLATVGIGVVNVLMTIVAILVIDRIGRKPLLLIGFAACWCRSGSSARLS